MHRIVTVILHKDGRFHLALPNCSREDAERWADSGYHVFLVAARSATLWAVNHVNSGKILCSDDGKTTDHFNEAVLPLLPLKKGEPE